MAGGAERVMSVIANYFAQKKAIEVHLVLLTKANIFFELDSRIIVHEPSFNYKNYNRLVFTMKIFWYLRRQLQNIKPYSLLSFGGRYNSLAMMAAKNLNIRTFISDRSRPDISYGTFLNFINRIVYRRATGIIAQTQLAKKYLYMTTRHKNITVIGNPVPSLFDTSIQKEKIMLNVGRFIKTKQQDLLIRIFKKIENEIDNDWQIWFLGNGEYLESCKKLAINLELNNRIQFLGNIKNIVPYYQRASVFAFTSVSEGFPNVLCEALSAGCACISFDRIAGANELITNNVNGILINQDDVNAYTNELKELLLTEEKIVKLQKQAPYSISPFQSNKIAEQFFKFILTE